MARRRSAARIVLLDSSSRILLFKARVASVIDPTGDAPGETVWLTPGGGVKPGETFEDAAVRELREETGIDDATLLATLWIRKHLLVDVGRGEPLEVYEHYYLARVQRSSISIRNQTAVERRVLRAHRWWTFEEIRQSSEVFVPRSLGELLEPICRGEIPQSPLRIGR